MFVPILFFYEINKDSTLILRLVWYFTFLEKLEMENIVRLYETLEGLYGY